MHHGKLKTAKLAAGLSQGPGRLRKMAPAKKCKILEKAAEEAAEDYRTDKSLSGFEENDFYEYE